MTKKLTMTIGLPFSGKSTLAKEYAQNGYLIIDRDNLLKEIITSEDFQNNLIEEIESNNINPENPAELFAAENRIATEMLSAKVKDTVLNSKEKNFFYDATNIQRGSRAPIIELKSEGVEINGLYLKIPLDELKRRAELISADRIGKFNDVRNLDKFAEILEEPSMDEGFSSLKIHDFSNENKRELKFK